MYCVMVGWKVQNISLNLQWLVLTDNEAGQILKCVKLTWMINIILKIRVWHLSVATVLLSLQVLTRTSLRAFRSIRFI